MKQFNRIITLLLALVLAFGMVLPAGAADSPKPIVAGAITAGEASAKAGETVTVDVSIAENPGFAMLKVELSYDADKLTFNGAQSSFGSMTFNTYNLISGNVNLLWDKSNGDAVGDGVIATLSFTVKSGASGTANVALDFKEANNWSLVPIQMTAKGAAITIGSGSGSGGSGGAGTGTGTTANKITLPADTTGGTVSANATTAKKNDVVTLTLKPQKGQKLASLTVTTASGTQLALTKLNDTQYTFVMPGEAITVNASFAQDSASAWPYKDVSSSNWFYDAVAYVTDHGLMNGTASDLFSPNMDTTRAMVIMIIARLEHADVEGGTPWYGKAVAWAVKEGVSDGTNPTNTITREQLVTMLYRYAQLKKLNVSESSALTAFPDAGTTHEYALEAMRWGVGSGLINGINGKLEPRGNSTRAQIATMLMRFCQKYNL